MIFSAISKDGSVVLSKISNQRYEDVLLGNVAALITVSSGTRRIAKVASFEDHHDGCVIKCVRFRPICGVGSDGAAVPSVFASCGNDKVPLISKKEIIRRLPLVLDAGIYATDRENLRSLCAFWTADCQPVKLW
jgi:hypothetical protein